MFFGWSCEIHMSKTQLSLRCQRLSIFYILLEHMDRGPSTTVISETLNVWDIQENPDSLLNVWCVCVYIYINTI